MIIRSQDWYGHFKTLYLYFCINFLLNFDQCNAITVLLEAPNSAQLILCDWLFNILLKNPLIFEKLAKPSTLICFIVPMLATQTHNRMHLLPDFIEFSVHVFAMHTSHWCGQITLAQSHLTTIWFPKMLLACPDVLFAQVTQCISDVYTGKPFYASPI